MILVCWEASVVAGRVERGACVAGLFTTITLKDYDSPIVGSGLTRGCPLRVGARVPAPWPTDWKCGMRRPRYLIVPLLVVVAACAPAVAPAAGQAAPGRTAVVPAISPPAPPAAVAAASTAAPQRATVRVGYAPIHVL